MVDFSTVISAVLLVILKNKYNKHSRKIFNFKGTDRNSLISSSI
nr:MAG TPA: hypothetical protein [Caudoviricetes sp.]